MHRPAFPYKFKFKTVGCAVDCNASIARADCSIIGTWKGKIAVDQAEVANYAKKGMDIKAEIVDLCPTQCVSYDGSKLTMTMRTAPAAALHRQDDQGPQGNRRKGAHRS